MKIRNLLLAFILAIASLSTLAQEKTYTTQFVTGEAPEIDGFAENYWNSAPWGNSFVQRSPYEGKMPTEQTAFKILYDNNNIYVLIHAYDSETEKIVKRLSRRDGYEGDWVQIEIDSYNDNRTAFTFNVSAAGVKSDAIISNDGDSKEENWDPIWYAATEINSEGWVAEIRIPLSQLRFSDADNQTWGLQVSRKIFRFNEISVWQFVPQKAPGWVSFFGELNGIENIEPKRQFEIAPYTVAKVEHYQKDSENPYSLGTEKNITGGVDGKIGITNNLTLDFTINPDFGQVEADPSEVNLTAYETYLQEKRPFFIEGGNITNFQLTQGGSPLSNDNLFYSRRIGRSPHFTPETSDNEYYDSPNNSSILGAFKLSGKTQNGISLGLIETVTSKEVAEIDYLGNKREVTVEPLTNYFIGRLQKDYNQGNTSIGAMVTTTNRNIEDAHLEYLHNSAYSYGIDFSHQWKDKTYYLLANFVVSKVNGTQQAIYETQTSPVRYFQRPDAPHLNLDSSKTSLTGQGGTIHIGKSGNQPFKFGGWLTWRSPELELNDVGFLFRTDEIFEVMYANYSITEPFSIFRSVGFNFDQWTGFNFNGDNLFSGFGINGYAEFKNQWTFSNGVNFDGNGISQGTLRGGPALFYNGSFNYWMNLSTDERKKLQLELGCWTGRGFQDSFEGYNIWGMLTYRPLNALSLTFSPSFSHQQPQMQYVENVEFENENRYIFAKMEQTTFVLETRINLNITPNLTIQYFGQPFVSVGEYSEFKHIINAGAKNPQEQYRVFSPSEITYDSENLVYNINEQNKGNYSFDDPNFNYKQFLSNLVLRWEYIPGSTIYVVWSQGRTAFETDGNFSYRQDMNNLFSEKPYDTFLVKFSYRFKI